MTLKMFSTSEQEIEQLKEVLQGFELIEVQGIPGQGGIYSSATPKIKKLPSTKEAWECNVKLEFEGRRHLDKLTEREMLTYYDTLLYDKFENWGISGVSDGWKTGEVIEERNAAVDCYIFESKNSAQVGNKVREDDGAAAPTLYGATNNWAVNFGEAWWADYVFTGYFYENASGLVRIGLRADPHRTGTLYANCIMLLISQANNYVRLLNYPASITSLTRANYATPTATWHYFKAIAIADMIYCYINGDFVGKAINSYFPAGAVSVGSATTDQYFSNLMVKVAKPRLLGHAIGLKSSNIRVTDRYVPTSMGMQARSINPQVSVEYETENLNTPIRRGLIGEYLFNESGGSKLMDHSGRENHGDITGATWVFDQDRRQWCLEFDQSSDYVDFPVDDMITALRYHTIEMIFRADKWSADTSGTLFNISHGTTATYYVLSLQGTGHYRFVFRNAGTYHQYQYLPSAIFDEWLHLIVITHPLGNKVLINKIQKIPSSYSSGGLGLTKAPIDFTNTADNHILGCIYQSSSRGNYLNGKIQRYRIWDRPLSDDEIEQLHYNEFGREY